MKQHTEAHCPLFLKFPLGIEPRYQFSYKVLYNVNGGAGGLNIDQQIFGASLNSFLSPGPLNTTARTKRWGGKEKYFFFPSRRERL